jgi:hypothetical protein
MISPALRELVRPVQFLNRILWIALTASICINAYVAFLIAQRAPGPSEASPAVQTSLAGAALVAGIVSLLMARHLLSDERLRTAMQSDPDPRALAKNPQTGAVDETRLQKIQALASTERKLLTLTGVFFTPFILRLVVNQAISIFGLVLALLSHSFTPILPFTAAALALNLTCLPRMDALLERGAQLVH